MVRVVDSFLLGLPEASWPSASSRSSHDAARCRVRTGSFSPLVHRRLELQELRVFWLPCFRMAMPQRLLGRLRRSEPARPDAVRRGHTEGRELRRLVQRANVSTTALANHAELGAGSVEIARSCRSPQSVHGSQETHSATPSWSRWCKRTQIISTGARRGSVVRR